MSKRSPGCIACGKSAGRAVVLLISLAIASLASLASHAAADTREAMLEPGKRTLYQRVIIKPNAVVTDDCDVDATSGTKLPAFSIYYVYSRDDRCVEIGANTNGLAKGFVKRDMTVDWMQSIVVAFNNREDAGRQRQLLFKDKEALQQATDPSTGVAGLADLRSKAETGTLQDSSGVIAIEPAGVVDIEQNFYVMPILDFQSVFLTDGKDGNFQRLNFLRIGAVSDVRSPDAPPRPLQPEAKPTAALAFIIDTTRSMQPYIDQATDVVRQIQSKLSADDVGDDVRFGIIGFRQSVEKNPGVEYHVKTFLPLGPQSGAQALLGELTKVNAATIPTRGFDEDSFGAVREAIDKLDWSGSQARIAVLITDAGPAETESADSLAGGMGADQLADLARRKGIRFFVMHLRTPPGRQDHDFAEGEYRKLTTVDGHDAYLPIAEGKISEFGQQMQQLCDTIINLIHATEKGEALQPVDSSPSAAVMARVGRALQLEYFGQRQDATVPQFFEAWTTDMSLEDPSVPALDERVMLTKNQLSSLAEALRPIVEQGEAPGSQADPADFFRRVQELAARANNDTRQISDGTPLGEVLGEYLQDLPYRSYVLNLTGADWVSFNRQKQREILSMLKSKLAYYEMIHSTPSKWIKLDEDADDGEVVTLVPLFQLP
ncbi:VWA domain-containing protein [Mesorhizobium sp. BR1-1-16]|uniref:vWA domain-containing protein n=1 Tax=Mesorhizobium sp. BR1-1-16 TaxID=2876653 RepID=UPI001CCAE554|nr:vWA domain-containing protein [Mesorhizobium sp. BR1-1-16]MBZ9938993.1 VWA domain-containing protein [Mesorhizobium sp. BR1-1-16]